MKLAEWERTTSKSFAPLYIETDSPGLFEAHLREVVLEDVHLYDMQTSMHRVVRSSELIDPQAPAFCKLSLQIKGQCILEQDGRTCTLGPGDLGLYVTQRPYSLSYPSQQSSMVVIFPQSLMHMSPDQIELITAIAVSRNSGLGRVAVPLFEQLAQNMQELSGPHALSLVKSALDILMTVLSSETRDNHLESSPTYVFHRAVSYIDAHLDDIELTPAKIADALFISLRQLHTRFSERNLTVATFIKSRRLQAIKQDLANPLLAHESVQTISARYGWLDAAYISKAFKAEFGLSPSTYRRQTLSGGQ